jgi:uncharacterized protein (DUF1501 family)
MKRRAFIKTAVPAAVIPSLIGGFTFEAIGATSWLSALTSATTETDHVLVLIQLNGGNDGLNTVIPIDQYSNLSSARSNIILPENKILPLAGFAATGLHPAMTGLKTLFDEGKLAVLQSVGYPSPNYSHFRATDIWLTASDSNQVLSSGWAGRYLNEEYPNFPVGYPNTTMPDPLAIQIGSVVSPGLQGPGANMGMAISDPNNFYNLINGVQDVAPNTPAGKELTYIRQVTQQTQQFATVIKAAAAKVTQQVPYPTSNSLANQLKIVSRLIAGGLKTRIYMVSIGGFDTHAGQVDATQKESGFHASLLKKVSDAIKAFQDDLTYLKVANRVVGMTFSEFGRRVKSNSSGGTDHGAAAPLFVFGEPVKGGVLGTNPVIGTTVNEYDNLPMQHDFRSVYASLLQNWFCVPTSTLNNVMLKNFQSLDLIKPSYTCSKGGIITNPNLDAGKKLITNYPNPFIGSTTIEIITTAGYTLVQIFNVQGQLIKVLQDGVMTAGTHQLTFEDEGWGPGIYYARLQNGSIQQMRTLVIAR